MKDICFCVVLYKSEIQNSKTINTLLENIHYLDKYKMILYIHNNGPKKININFSDFPKNLEVRYTESLNNSSLSSIYNKAINTTDSRYICLLDQDSELSLNYIKAISDFILSERNLLLPLIYAKGKIRCPRIYFKSKKGIILNKEQKIQNKLFPRTVGSGIVLSGDLSKYLIQKYGSVFDERFYIYKVDTTFFYRVQSLTKFNIDIKGYINHNMAGLEKEEHKSKKFRQTDTAAGWALQEKYYIKSTFLYFLLKAMNRYAFSVKLNLFITSVSTFYKGMHPFVKK